MSFMQDARTRFWCRDRPGDPFPNPTSHLAEQGAATESGDQSVPLWLTRVLPWLSRGRNSA